jgi:hypothetical protein
MPFLAVGYAEALVLGEKWSSFNLYGNSAAVAQAVRRDFNLYWTLNRKERDRSDSLSSGTLNTVQPRLFAWYYRGLVTALDLCPFYVHGCGEFFSLQTGNLVLNSFMGEHFMCAISGSQTWFCFVRTELQETSLASCIGVARCVPFPSTCSSLLFFWLWYICTHGTYFGLIGHHQLYTCSSCCQTLSICGFLGFAPSPASRTTHTKQTLSRASVASYG